MSLMRLYYDPLTEFDRLFDDALASRFRSSVAADIGRTATQHANGVDFFRPRMDIHESKDSNTVTGTFELPGMKSDEIIIDVHQNRLTVDGEAKRSH